MENKKAFFHTRSLFWGFGISLICNVANTSFWISVILGLVAGVITLLLVKNTNQVKFIKMLSGFSFTVLSTIILTYMSSTLYLKETPDLILSLVAAGACFIISSNRDGPYRRFVSILFIFAIFVFLSSHLLLLKEAKPENLFPLFNTSVKNVLYGSVIFYLYSITPVLTLNNLEDKKSTLLCYITGCLSVMLSILLVVMVLGMNEALMYRYPEYGLLKRIKVFEFFSNVDNIFMIIMIIDLLVTGSSGVRNMELKSKMAKLVSFVLVVALSLFLEVDAGRVTVLYSRLPLFILILLILTLVPIKSSYKKSIK